MDEDKVKTKLQERAWARWGKDAILIVERHCGRCCRTTTQERYYHTAFKETLFWCSSCQYVVNKEGY